MNDKKLSNLFWIFTFLIIILLSAFVYFIIQGKSQQGKAVEIYVNGELIDTVSLEKDRTFFINNEFGKNEIRIKNQKISIISASCENKVCISQGEVHTSTAPLVCVPNKLVIQVINDETDVDLTV
ncbi:MAG: NusG domain II-containing protein [Clostridiales bacterium]|nr:NusG domain II-containing protein [Clostridiales bacterium]